MTVRTTDPMERIVEDALIAGGYDYSTDYGGGTAHRLDFHLNEHDVAIEVKRMHSARTGKQMARHPDVILAQGVKAVNFLADCLRGRDDESI